MSPTFLVGLISFCLIVYSNLNRPKEIDRKEYFLSPPKGIERFSFGYNEVMADIFWIRAIQDFDYCENPVAKHHCQGNSWLYRILDSVTELSPQFRMPLATGPIALSVVISDYVGASKLFDKAVSRYPNDWPILSRAAYHALYEENDKTKAAELLKQAAKQPGAPPWYYSLSGRLYAEDGKLELGEALLMELKAAQFDEKIVSRLESRLAEVKASQGKGQESESKINQ